MTSGLVDGLCEAGAQWDLTGDSLKVWSTITLAFKIRF
jgi:hypothetical protein